MRFGPISQAILDALMDGVNTSRGIGETLGIRWQTVSAKLTALRKKHLVNEVGRVHPDGGMGRTMIVYEIARTKKCLAQVQRNIA